MSSVLVGRNPWSEGPAWAQPKGGFRHPRPQPPQKHYRLQPRCACTLVNKGQAP